MGFRSALAGTEACSVSALEEARRTLQRVYGEAERARLRAEAVAHIRDLHARGLLPKGGGVDFVDIVREMRDKRERQLAEAIEGRRGADR